jgi:glycosyltransferase involved in cell wall biosynthesis
MRPGTDSAKNVNSRIRRDSVRFASTRNRSSNHAHQEARRICQQRESSSIATSVKQIDSGWKTEPMRVLHLVKTAAGAMWALRQMRELVKLGVNVHAMLPPGPLFKKYHEAGVISHAFQADFPARNPWRISRLLSQFRDRVEAISPDVIHSHFVGTTLTMRLALGRDYPVPRIFQAPGPLHLESRFFRWMELATAKSNDYWIGSCRWTCSRYRDSGISENRVFLSYYGTDIDAFSDHARGKLRNELAIANEKRIVGMVAYMYAPKRYLGQTRGLKGHEDLIDALAICHQRNPGILGVFVGGTWNNALKYEQHIRDYAKRYCPDGVLFLGNRHDVPELYPDFDVAVHPSHSENVGGAVESLLMRVPTIATSVGGFPDLVINNRTGWLVSPRNPPELADAILKVLDDPRHADVCAVNGRKLAQQIFDVRTTSREIFGIYERVLGES